MTLVWLVDWEIALAVWLLTLTWRTVRLVVSVGWRLTRGAARLGGSTVRRGRRVARVCRS